MIHNKELHAVVLDIAPSLTAKSLCYVTCGFGCRESWKQHFPIRDLVAFSVAPLLLYPTHYTGEDGYISDTENSQIVENELDELRDDL